MIPYGVFQSKLMKKKFLSVIIPCYNEEKNLKRCVLGEVNKFMTKKNFSWEVMISDDGSTDNSKKIIRSQIKFWRNFRLLENPHGGKPLALWQGIKSSNGEWVLFTDMDQSTPISQLERLLPFIGNKVGAVIGSRGLKRKNFPLYRKFGSIVFAAMRKTLILKEIDDTQCGFKLFKRDIVKKAFPKLQYFKDKRLKKGWIVTSFDAELLFIVKKMGYAIEEVPVSWEDADVSGKIGRAHV